MKRVQNLSGHLWHASGATDATTETDLPHRAHSLRSAKIHAASDSHMQNHTNLEPQQAR